MAMEFCVAVFIALNIVPSDITVLEIVDPAGRTANGQTLAKVIRLTKKDTGGWSAVDLPKDELGSFVLQGTKLGLAPPEDERRRGNRKEIAVDMGKVLSLPDALDWSKVRELQLNRRGTATISRKEKEAALDIGIVVRDKMVKRNLLIRWGAKMDE